MKQQEASFDLRRKQRAGQGPIPYQPHAGGVGLAPRPIALPMGITAQPVAQPPALQGAVFMPGLRLPAAQPPAGPGGIPLSQQVLGQAAPRPQAPAQNATLAALLSKGAGLQQGVAAAGVAAQLAARAGAGAGAGAGAPQSAGGLGSPGR
jgi:hypothetical protein